MYILEIIFSLVMLRWTVEAYVLVRTQAFQGILYWHVPVCAGMYWYVPVHTFLPDPVQVYRIPDGADYLGLGPGPWPGRPEDHYGQ